VRLLLLRTDIQLTLNLTLTVYFQCRLVVVLCSGRLNLSPQTPVTSAADLETSNKDFWLHRVISEASRVASVHFYKLVLPFDPRPTVAIHGPHHLPYQAKMSWFPGAGGHGAQNHQGYPPPQAPNYAPQGGYGQPQYP
jgi:hypothetical protein